MLCDWYFLSRSIWSHFGFLCMPNFALYWKSFSCHFIEQDFFRLLSSVQFRSPYNSSSFCLLGSQRFEEPSSLLFVWNNSKYLSSNSSGIIVYFTFFIWVGDGREYVLTHWFNLQMPAIATGLGGNSRGRNNPCLSYGWWGLSYFRQYLLPPNGCSWNQDQNHLQARPSNIRFRNPKWCLNHMDKYTCFLSVILSGLEKTFLLGDLSQVSVW